MNPHFITLEDSLREKAAALRDTLRRRFIPQQELDAIESQREKLSRSQEQIDDRIAQQNELVRAWEEQSATLQTNRERLAFAEHQRNFLATQIETARTEFEKSLGAESATNDPAYLACEISKGTAGLTIFEQGMKKLRAQIGAQIEALRTFGKKHGIPQEFWPDAL